MNKDMLSTVLTTLDAQARWCVSVVTKRTYVVTPYGIEDAPMQEPLVPAPILAEDGIQLAHDSDLLWRKPMVDVIVLGHAYPHENRPHCKLYVRVGALERTLAVFGVRRLERDTLGNVRITPPQVFEKISLGWESAFGGHDAAALQAYGDPSEPLRKQAGFDDRPEFGLYAYPRNPVGRGYLLEVSQRALGTCALPNIEDPADFLTPARLVTGNSLAWPGRPLPASTGWLPYTFFPRMSLLGLAPLLFDEQAFPVSSFAEVQRGLLCEEALDPDAPVTKLYDVRAAQGSAPGMRVNCVRPGDMVELRNAHPREPSWKFPLAVRAPQIQIRIPGRDPQPIEPTIRTVIIEPDCDRVRLVWGGESRIEGAVATKELDTIQHAVFWD